MDVEKVEDTRRRPKLPIAGTALGGRPIGPASDPSHRRSSWTSAIAGLVVAGTLCATALPAARAGLEVGVYEGGPWPIVPPPVALPIAPPRPPTGPPAAPATRAAARIVEILERIRATATDTLYQHPTLVRERDGVYRWDCSGMASWILHRAAPQAMRAIPRARPVARDFVYAIERAPIGRSRGGWQRLARIEDALPGDLFAWRRPRGFPSRNTGHVGFVMEAPVAVPEIPGAFAVRIADSTSFGHEDDSRAPESPGGFGIGTLVFLTDGLGHATHYGWAGTRSAGYVVTPIVFGRVTR